MEKAVDDGQLVLLEATLAEAREAPQWSLQEYLTAPVSGSNDPEAVGGRPGFLGLTDMKEE